MKKSFHDRLRHDIPIAIQNEVGSGAGGMGKKTPYQFFRCNFYKRRN